MGFLSLFFFCFFFLKDESIGCANTSGKAEGGGNRKVTNLGITRARGPRCLGQASRGKTTAGGSSLPAGLKVPYRRGQAGRGRDALPPGLLLEVSSTQEAGIHCSVLAARPCCRGGGTRGRSTVLTVAVTEATFLVNLLPRMNVLHG